MSQSTSNLWFLTVYRLDVSTLSKNCRKKDKNEAKSANTRQNHTYSHDSVIIMWSLSVVDVKYDMILKRSSQNEMEKT